ncbi:hypothetical protein Btru_000804 [Bulinus truncatus]|nr:hypothetical protein Btru_000804 [Bulinus truncatus]
MSASIFRTSVVSGSKGIEARSEEGVEASFDDGGAGRLGVRLVGPHWVIGTYRYGNFPDTYGDSPQILQYFGKVPFCKHLEEEWNIKSRCFVAAYGQGRIRPYYQTVPPQLRDLPQVKGACGDSHSCHPISPPLMCGISSYRLTCLTFGSLTPTLTLQTNAIDSTKTMGNGNTSAP